MPTQSRLSLVQALLGHLPEQSSPVVIVVKPDQHRPTPIRTNGHRNPPSTPVYDPSVVFVLEIATIIATCNSDSVALMGSAVADALQNVVRDATNVHPLVLSRAIFYLLTLLHASRVRIPIRLLYPVSVMLIRPRSTRSLERPLFCIRSRNTISLSSKSQRSQFCRAWLCVLMKIPLFAKR